MRLLLLIGAALCLASAASAQTAPAPPPRPIDCKAAEHRQLDFWVGEWRVFRTADQIEIASSRIEKILGGCAIKESYDSPGAPGGPYAGTSYSAWDFKDRRWRQMYVDTRSSVTLYTGGLDGADMVMTAPGAAGLQRMAYRPQPDGSVRQIGEVSTDEGKTWKPGYDYTYRRR